MAISKFLERQSRSTSEYEPYQGRYLVFAFGDYYPAGGQGDVVDSYDSLDDLQSAFRVNENEIEHVASTSQFKPSYRYIDILDMQERRFIDIVTLNFAQA